MAVRKIVSLDAERVYGLGGVDSKTGKANPTSIEGFYLGVKKVPSEHGESVIHVFQTSQGQEGIWGKTESNKLLANVPYGFKTTVLSTGKVKIGGGKTKCTFDVTYDDEQKIDVPNTPSASARLPQFAADEEIPDFRATTNVDDGDEEDVPTQAAALSASERQARVKAMLSGKKTK